VLQQRSPALFRPFPPQPDRRFALRTSRDGELTRRAKAKGARIARWILSEKTTPTWVQCTSV
jgi:hypothetical protein